MNPCWLTERGTHLRRGFVKGGQTSEGELVGVFGCSLPSLSHPISKSVACSGNSKLTACNKNHHVHIESGQKCLTRFVLHSLSCRLYMAVNRMLQQARATMQGTYTCSSNGNAPSTAGCCNNADVHVRIAVSEKEH